MSNDLLRSYFTLDLNPTAKLEQVRAAYHDLIKVWHQTGIRTRLLA